MVGALSKDVIKMLIKKYFSAGVFDLQFKGLVSDLVASLGEEAY